MSRLNVPCSSHRIPDISNLKIHWLFPSLSIGCWFLVFLINRKMRCVLIFRIEIMKLISGWNIFIWVWNKRKTKIRLPAHTTSNRTHMDFINLWQLKTWPKEIRFGVDTSVSGRCQLAGFHINHNSDICECKNSAVKLHS